MTGPRVEDLVLDAVGRTYLKPYGWWAQLVLDQFAFLLDHGFSLAGPRGGVHFHQNGNWVTFTGQHRDVSVDYDPESGWYGAAVLEQAGEPTRIDLGLRRVRIDPSNGTQGREAIEQDVRRWAARLREYPADVLAGLQEPH